MVSKKLSPSLRCADKQEFHEPVESAEHEVSTGSGNDRVSARSARKHKAWGVSPRIEAINNN